MTTRERTSNIITNLDEVGEDLLALSDDIWLAIDHNDTVTMREGVAFKEKFNGKLAEFRRLAEDLRGILAASPATVVKAAAMEDPLPPAGSIEEEPDETEFHRLDENFTFKRPAGLKVEETYYGDLRTWRAVFHEFCQHIAARHSDKFSALVSSPGFDGRTGSRLFSRDPAELRAPMEVTPGIFAELHFSANALCQGMLRMLPMFALKINEVGVQLRDGGGESHQPHTNEREVDSSFREACLARLQWKLKEKLRKLSLAFYEGETSGSVIGLSLSKSYSEGQTFEFWFTLNQQQVDRLQAVNDASVAFGCGSPEGLLLIPFKVFEQWMPVMSSVSDEGTERWHVKIGSAKQGFPLFVGPGVPRHSLSGYRV